AFVVGGIMLAVNLFAPRKPQSTIYNSRNGAQSTNWDSIRLARKDSAKAYWDSVRIVRRDSGKAYWDSVRIAHRDSAKAYWDSLKTARKDSFNQVKDSVYGVRIAKRDTILDLNTADTMSLQYLRGIGPYIAKRIVWYRQDLGGFVSKEQLREMDDLCRYNKDTTHRFKFDSVLPHLVVDTSLVQRLPINTMTAAKLSKHPYINYTQARAIYELRRRKFNLQPKDLTKVLSEEEAQRLMPYIDWTKKTKR
ncbi:MAG: helix-hairpin-helix domain-containing protein, partial [Paludibacteraceae bacterium]|nr:helix-hairpin-helix domain-containing protein [Paludibacteraceae bacterium]